jgi:cobalt-zinc-cadmium efflux system protein
MLVEIVGGLLAGSLVLLADAGHMFTDVAALGLSLLAMRWARRTPSPERSFGWVRAEILTALVNGVALVVIAGAVLWEAVQRLRVPAAVDAPVLLGVAAAGLVVNLVGLRLLHGHAHDNLNVRGAYLHVFGDLLGSIGALAAGMVILTTGWSAADPLASMVIAVLILVSSVRLVRDATDVLMEAAPRHVDVRALQRDLSDIEGLHDVHDVHVWTLTSGFVALSAHGVLHDPLAQRRVLDEVRDRAARHGVQHVTFQTELTPPVRLRRDPPEAPPGEGDLA